MSATRGETTAATPVLFVGGSGLVGRSAIAWFRERNPDVPVLVGGRDLERAEKVAASTGNARALSLDADRPGMGLPEDLRVAAVVMLVPDGGSHGQRFAHDHSVPYLGIGDGLVEIGPGAALFARRATSAPIVLGSHWAAGAGVFVALEAAAHLERVHSVHIGALLDERDPAGPLAREDMHRLDAAAPAAMAFDEDRRVWLDGSSAPGSIETVDRRSLTAHPYAPFDIIGVRAATEAPSVRFDLATGVSSRRAAGGEPSAEIIVEVTGEADGRPAQVRSTLEFPHGQASLTGLVVALTMSAALGLEGSSPLEPGLHFPETVAEPSWFLAELRAAGAIIGSSVG